ncbi:hypothetical protein CC80DRAFT_497820 [Byssothecium circinans]|uniref:Mitochondrial export protein Som1 n=1 Tax=Byssothecium circinans TaxID=147558 RepID=A0A6A5T8S7_9PLEO|nr:hypothetical protein CC80DRAFT_497820 [Byssothecium circinans]
MAPPLPLIPPSALEAELNTLPSGKPRRPPLVLTDCALKELVQYKCNIDKPVTRGARPVIYCEPVVRLIRQCANGVHVETTAWEGWKAGQERERVLEKKT